MVAFWRADLTCAFANGAYLEWFGRAPDAMFGIHLRTLLGDVLFEQNRRFIEGALEGREQQFERTLVKADGSSGRTLASYIPRFNEAGQVLGFVAQVLDISPLEETRRSLALSALVMDCMAEGVIVTDLAGTIVSVNPAFTSITGFESSEVVGQTTHFLGLDRRIETFREMIVQAVRNVGYWRGDIRSTRKDGTSFIAEQTTTIALGADKEPLHYVSLFHDVTEARANLDLISRQATTDPLTGLHNRGALMKKLEALTASAAGFALLFIDLDQFKAINDRHGHAAGDQVLRVTAHRLRNEFRDHDFVARLAGDEFVVIVTREAALRTPLELCSRVEQALCGPIGLDGETLLSGSSVGMASYPSDGRTADELLAQADMAMYAAKRARGRLQHHPVAVK